MFRSEPTSYPLEHLSSFYLVSPISSPTSKSQKTKKRRREISKEANMQFWKSRSDEAVDDFDDYDPTPYSGGYDLTLTYGRPLPPSDETCYSTSTAGDIDYERPHYSSGSQVSVYEAEDADFGDRYGRSRPKPRPKPPQIDSTSAYGGDAGEFGSGYESGYGGGRPKRQEGDEGYWRKDQQESGYAFQEETNRYGEEGYGGSGYRKEERYGKPTYGGGEYRRSDGEGYGGGEEGYGGGEQFGYGGRTGYERPSYGGEEEEEGSGRYKKSSYGDEEEKSGYGRGRPRYGGEEDQGFRRSEYGNESYDDGENKHGYQKKHHYRHNYDED